MRILRFDITTRVLHWSHAILFIWLLLTGIQLFFTQKSLLGDPLIRTIHLYASLPFVLLPAIAYFFGSTSLHDDLKELLSWTDDDSRSGKFNGGQKTNFMIALPLIFGLSFSGFIVWMKSMFSVNFVELNFLIHDFLAIISLLQLTGHIMISFR